MNTTFQTQMKTAPSPSFTPPQKGLLQRKCSFSNNTMAGSECAECSKKKRSGLQTKLMVNKPGDIYEQEADRVADQVMAAPAHIGIRSAPPHIQRFSGQSNGQMDAAPGSVDRVLASSGRPLEPALQQDMGQRFGHDFSRVRVHSDSDAEQSARDVNAHAYTVGRDMVFGAGRFAPEMYEGRRLLAHELTHVVQQSGADRVSIGQDMGLLQSDAGMQELGDQKASIAQSIYHTTKVGTDQAAANALTGQQIVAPIFDQRVALSLQRQVHGAPSPISVRSPAFEEFVTQASTVQAGLAGRSLDVTEIRLARSVFGPSIDYSRVRLIPTGILKYITVANTIRVPENFTITDEYMGETLIHELTHVWQYQHGGTSYISVSLAAQIAGTIRTGSRNAAYDYQIAPGASFFEFTPEQQGLIVENYFTMLHDQSVPPRIRYRGNHLDASGEFQILSEPARVAEIARELPMHQLLIEQMRTALPRPEVDLLSMRATEVMLTPFEGAAPVPAERQIAPLKPLLELRF